MASKPLLFKTILPTAFEAPMKPFALLALFLLLLSDASLNTASAQPSKPSHPMVKSKSASANVGGVDTITANEADNKNPKPGSGWDGSYVGVNAGTSFGATAGTNVVIPLGTDSDK